MGKTNFRRMMMLRDHDKDREPERDRIELVSEWCLVFLYCRVFMLVVGL